MALDSKVKEYLETISGGAPLNTLEPEEARFIAKMDFKQTSGTPEQVKVVKDQKIPVKNGEIDIRIFTPFGDGPFPVLVYYHGGGWVLGDIDDFSALMQSLAAATNAIVVGVNYRLAPEYKFPTAVEDSYAAFLWVAKNIEKYNGNPAKIAVIGDSAGGNLAAVTSILARDNGGPRITYQVLIYPATDLRLNSNSLNELSEGYFLSKEDMIWFRDQYLSKSEDQFNPLGSPLLKEDLTELPQALIITAEYDPLKDEGEAYGEKLKAASVKVDLVCFEGMIHTFVAKAKLFEQAKEAIDLIANTLKSAFTK